MNRLLLAGLTLTCCLSSVSAEVGDVWEFSTAGPFAGRSGYTLIEFKDRFWATGGTGQKCDPPCIPGEPCNTCFAVEYDDLWVSDDGESWVRIYEHVPFIKRSFYRRFIEYKSYLYVLGGGCCLNSDSIWRSPDGVEWEPVGPEEYIWERSGVEPPIVFDGKLLIIGTAQYSTDGLTWESDERYVPNRVLTASGKAFAAVLGDHIYAYQPQHVWKSADGYEWELLTGNTNVLTPLNDNVGFAAFAGYLWAGGRFEGGGMIWRSSDGANWEQKVISHTARAVLPTFTSFRDHLYLGGGKIEHYRTRATCNELLGSPHASDRSNCGRLDLTELLRAIQLFSFAEFHCNASGEDGYAAGPPTTEGEAACAPHSADYDPQDWSITLNELLRVVQIYNAGAYTSCPNPEDSEDGFCFLD